MLTVKELMRILKLVSQKHGKHMRVQILSPYTDINSYQTGLCLNIKDIQVVAAPDDNGKEEDLLGIFICGIDGLQALMTDAHIANGGNKGVN